MSAALLTHDDITNGYLLHWRGRLYVADLEAAERAGLVCKPGRGYVTVKLSEAAREEASVRLVSDYGTRRMV